jgi:tetratricopeptide (TPR) repeat protein
MAVAFSPDGQTLASGSGDKSVRLWDAKTGQPRATLKGHTGEVRSVAFSPDGRALASAAGDRVVRLWDVATGRPGTTLQGPTSDVVAVAFSPDGRTLAGGCVDKTALVRLWDVGTGQATASLQGHTGQVWSVAFSPDGQTLASGSLDNTVRLWDVKTGQARAILRGHTEGVRCVAFSADGQTLASGSDTGMVLLWDVKTGQFTATLKGHTEQIFAVAFSPDGRSLASGSADDTVRLWDTGTGPTRATLQGQTDGVQAVAFGPDGRCVFGWDSDGQVHAWSVADSQPTHASEPPPPARGTVTKSPDGAVRAEARGYGIVLIDVEAERRDRKERRALEPLYRVTWHRQQAAQAEEDGNWFAAEFHLRQLLKATPNDTDLKRRHLAALFPRDARAICSQGVALVRAGRHKEAEAAFGKVIELQPRNAYSYDWLAFIRLSVGDPVGALPFAESAVRLDGKSAQAHRNLGRAQEGVGDPQAAVASFRKAIELDPKHDQARTWLERAERLAAVEGNLPALLKGNYKPKTNDERLALALLCKFKRLHRTSAGMYADAFADDPRLADDLKAAYRYCAASSAALAGTAQGKDAAGLDDQEKARLRRQSLDWLRADLALRTRQLESGKPADRAQVQRKLKYWQKDRDLAGIRGEDALAKLPAEERAACEKLWAGVAALLKKTVTPKTGEGKQ